MRIAEDGCGRRAELILAREALIEETARIGDGLLFASFLIHAGSCAALGCKFRDAIRTALQAFDAIGPARRFEKIGALLFGGELLAYIYKVHQSILLFF